MHYSLWGMMIDMVLQLLISCEILEVVIIISSSGFAGIICHCFTLHCLIVVL